MRAGLNRRQLLFSASALGAGLYALPSFAKANGMEAAIKAMFGHNVTFTPLSGRAKVAGRVRLAGTQNVHAIAELSDGSLYRASANSFVTIAACIIL